LKFSVGSGGSGDFGPYMAQRLSAGQWIFYFTFDLAIRFVLLNVIRGITVDTFSELRIAKILRLKDTLETCFICGLHKQFFDRDRLSHGFIHHIRQEHNMWNYLFFIIYLWEQDKDDDDGLEQYVRRSIEKDDINWIPTNKAMGLSEATIAAAASTSAGTGTPATGTGTFTSDQQSSNTAHTTRYEFQKYLTNVEHSLVHRLNEFQALAVMKSNHVKNELTVIADSLIDGPSTWRSLSVDEFNTSLTRNDSLPETTPGMSSSLPSPTTGMMRMMSRHTVKKNFPNLTIQIIEINGFDFPSRIYDTSISCVIRCSGGVGGGSSGVPALQVIESQHIYHSVEEGTRKKNSVVHFPPNTLVEVVKSYQNLTRINSMTVVIQVTRKSNTSTVTSTSQLPPSSSSQPTASRRSQRQAQAQQQRPSQPPQPQPALVSRIFVGSIRLTVGELMGHLDTAVEKSFTAQVLDHECDGVLTFIPSLCAGGVSASAGVVGVVSQETEDEEEEKDEVEDE
jgi:hypothetical protein